MELIRTVETMTAGIVNTPLTKPAKLFFIPELKDLAACESVFNAFNIPFTTIFRNSRWFVSSINELDSKTLKAIWHNHRTLKPKISSQWKYLFWENDNHDIHSMQYVLQVYAQLNLPVYYHKSMRGYHFMSVKPITKELWQLTIPKLRALNQNYPPITLRLKANKYVNELDVYREGYLQLLAPHSDTVDIKNWIEQQNIAKIQEKYFVVFYPFKKELTI